jgi:hypothetical protein
MKASKELGEALSRARLRTPKELSDLLGSTVVSVDLKPRGHSANDRVVYTLRLADGSTWRVPRGRLRDLTYHAMLESPVEQLLKAHLAAGDRLHWAETARDRLQKIADEIREHFAFHNDDLPLDEALRIVDPHRILEEVRAEDAEWDTRNGSKQDVAPQAATVKASDLEVDL